jgi:hypothetical protein
MHSVSALCFYLGYQKQPWFDPTGSTVSFTDLDQGREILNRFSLPKSMKHSSEFHGFRPRKGDF